MYEISYNRRFVVVKSPRFSVKSLMESGETKYLMHSQSTGQYFDLDDDSKTVWDLIDGNRNLGQIIDEYQTSGEAKESEEATSGEAKESEEATSGEAKESEEATSGEAKESEEVIDTLLFFAESGALMAKEDPIRRKRVRIVSAFEIQAVLVRNSEKLLKLTHRILRPIMRGSLFWASMGIALVGAIIMAPRINSTLNDPRNFQVLGSTVVGFLFYQFVILAPVILIHELAHGVALVHYGGRAGEIGTGLFYFGPMFYVDSTDSWTLSRRQRIMIMWAGNLSTLLIGTLVVLIRIFLHFPPAIGLTLDMSAFWCFYITLWNLAPPFETDGYYILTDIVNTPDLKGDSFAYVKSLILRIFHRPTPEQDELTDKKRAIFLSYSIFSFAFVAYLVVQMARVSAYLAGDATSWVAKILQSASSGTSLPILAYLVGLISVSYFVMIICGYGVLVATRIRKSLAGTLRFEALYDRNLSVFFHVPSGIPASRQRKLELKVRSKAREMTSNSSVVQEGPLLYANLKMGETSLPLSQLTVHLRRIEDGFYRAYRDFLQSTLKDYPLSAKGSKPIPELLFEMASNTSPGVRSEARGVLKEFLLRQQKHTAYVLSSTFATAWTIEVPPVEEGEVLEDLFSTLLVRDLTMTNLAEESEEFKKKIIYGLDSIAQFAADYFKMAKEELAHPERFQVITSFEPIKGRIVFVGRTERIEKDLKELGSLFMIQVWSGYLDNLLADTNLNLFSVVQSLPPIPSDISSLRDGEVQAIDRYASGLQQLGNHVSEAVLETPMQIQSCRTKLEELKTLLQPEETSTLGLLESILALNHENIESIPSRIKELGSLSKETFGWIDALRETAAKEREKRDVTYLARRRKVLKSYALVGSMSAILFAAGLSHPPPFLLLPLIGTAVSIQGAYLGAFYILRRFAYKVPRYPSTVFNQFLTPIYALTQTMHSLTVGVNLLDPREIIEGSKK